MERVLYGLHWKTLLLYLDDVVVIAPTFVTYIERLKEVLSLLRKAGLKQQMLDVTERDKVFRTHCEQGRGGN